MKKTARFLIPALILSIALCGCAYDTAEDRADVTVTPYVNSDNMMDDMKDGIVDDMDGIIDNENARAGNNTNDSLTGNNTTNSSGKGSAASEK